MSSLKKEVANIHGKYNDMFSIAIDVMIESVMVAKAFYHEKYFNCLIDCDNYTLAYTGKKWWDHLKMSREQIAATPIFELMYGEPEILEWQKSNLMLQDEHRNKNGNIFTHYMVAFQGDGDPFYVKFIDGSLLENNMWMFRADEGTKEEYDTFVEKYYHGKEDR